MTSVSTARRPIPASARRHSDGGDRGSAHQSTAGVATGCCKAPHARIMATGRTAATMGGILPPRRLAATSQTSSARAKIGRTGWTIAASDRSPTTAIATSASPRGRLIVIAGPPMPGRRAAERVVTPVRSGWGQQNARRNRLPADTPYATRASSGDGTDVATGRNVFRLGPLRARPTIRAGPRLSEGPYPRDSEMTGGIPASRPHPIHEPCAPQRGRERPARCREGLRHGVSGGDATGREIPGIQKRPEKPFPSIDPSHLMQAPGAWWSLQALT